MKKLAWLQATGRVLCLSLLSALSAGGALADVEDALLNRLEDYQGISSMDQVTTVDEFSDVSPSHWAYSALQSLVERYDCVEGFPDGTFRGDKTLTRYEFAAALNECLNEVEGLLAALDSAVTQEDLQQLYALQQEFQAELAALGGRVDSLEARVDTLEAQQFSTTTKLEGEIIFELDSAFSGDNTTLDVEEQTTIGYRARLNFDTSFTGRDRLRTRLQTDNLVFFEDSVGTATASRNLNPLGFDNVFNLNQLWYQFPVGDNITVHIAPEGVLIDEIFNAAPTAGAAYDALNLTVAYNNLLYDLSNAEGTAAGANFLLGDKLQVDVGYWVPSDFDNNPSEGIFASNFSTGIHINYDATDTFSVSFGYIYSYYEGDSGYDLSGFVGSDNAQDPFGEEANSSNNLGLQFNWLASQNVGFGGFVGYAFADSKVSAKSADLLHAMLNIYFPDLGKEGDVLLLAAALAPKVIGASGGALTDDEATGDGTSFAIDLEYRYPFNDNIVTTFGGVAILSPEHNNDNATIFIGTVRTQFFF